MTNFFLGVHRPLKGPEVHYQAKPKDPKHITWWSEKWNPKSFKFSLWYHVAWANTGTDIEREIVDSQIRFSKAQSLHVLLDLPRERFIALHDIHHKVPKTTHQVTLNEPNDNCFDKHDVVACGFEVDCELLNQGKPLPDVDNSQEPQEADQCTVTQLLDLREGYQRAK